MYRFTFVHRSRQMLYSKQKLRNSLDVKNGNNHDKSSVIANEVKQSSCFRVVIFAVKDLKILC